MIVAYKIIICKKNPALQKADTAVKIPYFNPVKILCSINEKAILKMIAPANSTKKVYLKINISEFFMSSLLSASKIYLAVRS